MTTILRYEQNAGRLIDQYESQGLESKVEGRTGVVMFHAYWTRDGKSATNASGGHIDLWNGSLLTISGLLDGFATIGRYLGRQSVLPGTRYGYSDRGNSKIILFWEIK